MINFSAGHCYRAASPLLGADGELGEIWTLLGTKLIQSGLYRTGILIPAASSGRRNEPPPSIIPAVAHAIRLFRPRVRELRQKWAEMESQTLPGPAAGRHHRRLELNPSTL